MSASRVGTSRMRRTQRVDAILAELRTNGNVEVSDLSERFGVSEATLRRDLGLLAERNLVTRTHGGALAPDADPLAPPPAAPPASSTVQAMSRLAARSVPAGPQVVAFTGGATTTEVARRLLDRDGLTVVTAALDIAMEAAARQVARLVVLGGTPRPGSYELRSPAHEQALAAVNIGTLFVEAGGISADQGLTADDEELAATTRALVARARHVVVLAPGPAVGRVALTPVAPTSAVHEVITDAGADGPALSQLAEAGLRVGLVP